MEKEASPRRGRGVIIVLSILLIVVLIGTIILAVIVAPPLVGVLAAARASKSVIEPVGEFVRQLVADATPVILPNPVVIVREINTLARLETLFTDGNIELETTVRREAESRMLEAAHGNDILDQAQTEAERFIFSFLEGLGFNDVTFVDYTPPPVAPYEQEVPKGFALTPLPPVTSTPIPVAP
jgi:hypothetical protein